MKSTCFSPIKKENEEVYLPRLLNMILDLLKFIS
ncbi:hypothetical protein ZPR_1340 [Zunongwangia profunda SM-A87]|uniref:Uncharacterized protein n=1 Tax=Zunongwangia profunda (strain DSM 18752 / CCTCC AB 206139 / SM-A87) TaxID=655815 RepID=D5BJL0_ZUNPS|nr:hypothetical protein ZPR_1340 [Zunongwangia profunda SM-A87]